MALPSDKPGSSLLLDEYFNGEDSRFIEELRKINDPKKLAALAERWKKDPRPWARKQIFEYLALPLDRNGHQPLIKRLYKHAEAQNDDELLAVFMVLFDGLVRRVRRTRRKWDSQSRQPIEFDELFAPRNSQLAEKLKYKWYRPRPGGVIFSYHTRYYLRRRAWRYFRRAGFKRSGEYVKLLAPALAAYKDESLAKGENVLDSWALLHACFQKSDALEFSTSHVRLKEGRGLGELTAAPAFPKLWAKAEAAPVLLHLVTGAQSRLVRVFSIQLLRAKHAESLRGANPDDLLKLLDHDDDEVQQFGAELLQNAAGLDKLPVQGWLRLLQTRNLTALQTICDTFLKQVQPERLELAQCIELTCSRPAPVARLGLALLKARRIETPEDRSAISAVADARCAAAGDDIAQWAFSVLGRNEVYDRDSISKFFDSLLEEIREAAWLWLKPGWAGYDDAGLWARLIETPYDNIRLRMVDLLEVRAKLPGTSADALTPIWCAVLLAIHRGGRQKSKAVRQIGAAILENPSRADSLLPVLAVAVRSVRGSESRAGLAALIAAVEAKPEIGESIKKIVPELILDTGG
jgi:hypothetical protein